MMSNAVLLHAGPPVVPIGRARHPTHQPGGWLTTDTRARKGKPLGGTVEVAGVKYKVDSSLGRWLTQGEMWTVYRRTPDVRAAIDSIVRRIATWDHAVEPTVEPDDDQWDAAREESDTQSRFLSAPNEDGDTWQELMTKMLTDLLVFDQGALELVRNRAKALSELVALRGSTMKPQTDDHGRLTGYLQAYESDDGLPTGKAVPFEADEIVFFRLFPTTAGPEGNPIIESIVDQVITLLRSANHVMLAYDADEIPPGIIVLTGISGKAADRAKADLQSMRGQDHKIRVLTNPDPTGAGASWVELRHTPKDLSMRDIVQDIRRVIWRSFGVTPAEMGEVADANRANMQAQVDVGASHLIVPILEIIEAKVTARILPLLATSPDRVGLTRFRFDRDVKLSPEDQERQGKTITGLIQEGVLSRNEGRKILGHDPVDSGDVITVSAAPVILEDALSGDDDPDPDPDGGSGGDPDDAAPPGEPDDAGEGGPEEPEEVAAAVEATWAERTWAEHNRIVGHVADIVDPRALSLALDIALTGSARRGRVRGHVHDNDCDCGSEEPDAGLMGLVGAGLLPRPAALALAGELTYRRARDLPSDWQPHGRFKGYRTLDLPALGDVISRYAIDVRPLWEEARDEVLAIVGRAYERDRGGVTEEAAQVALNALADTFDKLEVRWRAATGPLYERAAEIGRDAASDFTGVAEVVADHGDRAEQYFGLAMGWLTAQDGPFQTVRRRVAESLRQATRSAARAIDAEDEHEAALLGTSAAAFDSQAHRIYNWSGKLNDLSNTVLLEGLREVERAEGVEGEVEWYVEWVVVGDNRTCVDCEREGLEGFRPLSTLSVQPGGDTQCRGNCRCVLVIWTRSEVDTGAAVRLGPVVDHPGL